MRSIPNPVRSLLLLVVVILFLSLGYLGAGTGGVDPSLIERDEGVSSSITVGAIVRGAGIPLLVVFSVGLGFAVILARPGGVLAGLRFALGSNRPEGCARAARALAIGTRAGTWCGLCVGVGACGVVGGMVILGPYAGVLRLNWETFTDIVWMAMSVALMVPLVAIVFIRLALGSLADAALIRSGESRGLAFGSAHDYWLAVVIIVPLFHMCLWFVK